MNMMTIIDFQISPHDVLNIKQEISDQKSTESQLLTQQRIFSSR
jgi:hypothetical protein